MLPANSEPDDPGKSRKLKQRSVKEQLAYFSGLYLWFRC